MGWGWDNEQQDTTGTANNNSRQQWMTWSDRDREWLEQTMNNEQWTMNNRMRQGQPNDNEQQEWQGRATEHHPQWTLRWGRDGRWQWTRCEPWETWAGVSPIPTSACPNSHPTPDEVKGPSDNVPHDLPRFAPCARGTVLVEQICGALCARVMLLDYDPKSLQLPTLHPLCNTGTASEPQLQPLWARCQAIAYHHCEPSGACFSFV